MVYNAALPNRVVVLLIDLASSLPQDNARAKDVPYLQNAAARFANLISCAVERLLAQFNSCSECNLLWSYHFFDSAANVTSSFSEERALLQPVRLANVEKFRRTIAKRVRSLDPGNRSPSVSYGEAIANVLDEALSGVDWKQYNAASSIDSFMEAEEGSLHNHNQSCRGSHSLMPSLFMFGRYPQTLSSLKRFVGLSQEPCVGEEPMSPRRRAARSLLQLRDSEWNEDGLDLFCNHGVPESETIDRVKKALGRMENFRQQLRHMGKRNITFVWVSSRLHRSETRPSPREKAETMLRDWLISNAKSVHVKELYSMLLDRRVLPVRDQTIELERIWSSSPSRIQPALEEENRSLHRNWSRVQVVFPKGGEQKPSKEQDIQFRHYFFAQMSLSRSSDYAPQDAVSKPPNDDVETLVLKGFVNNNLQDEQIFGLGGFDCAPQLIRPLKCSDAVSQDESDASAFHFAGLMVELAKSRQCLVAETLSSSSSQSCNSPSSRIILIYALTPSCAVARDFSGYKGKLTSLRSAGDLRVSSNLAICSNMSPCSPKDGVREMVSTKFFENFLPGIWPPKSCVRNCKGEPHVSSGLAGALHEFASVCGSNEISVALDGYNCFRQYEGVSSAAEAVQSFITSGADFIAKESVKKRERGLEVLKRLESHVEDIEDPKHSTFEQSTQKFKLQWKRKSTEQEESIDNDAKKTGTIEIQVPLLDTRNVRSSQNLKSESRYLVSPSLPGKENLLSHRDASREDKELIPIGRPASDTHPSKVQSCFAVSPTKVQSPAWRKNIHLEKTDSNPLPTRVENRFPSNGDRGEKMGETCTTATNARTPSCKMPSFATTNSCDERTIAVGKEVVERAAESYAGNVKKLACSPPKEDLGNIVCHCMRDLSKLAHELGKYPQSAILGTIIKTSTKSEDAVSMAFQTARQGIETSSREPEAIQPILWKAAFDAYEQVVWRVAKIGSAVLDPTMGKRRAKQVRRGQKQCASLLSCVQVGGETASATFQSLAFYHDSFSQFFADVLSQFLRGEFFDVFKDILESIFEGFEQNLDPLDPGRRNITSQSTKPDHAAQTGESQEAPIIAHSDFYMIPADDNVSSRSLKRRSNRQHPTSGCASVSKRPKVARKDPKQLVAQARNKSRKAEVTEGHRSQFSRDISRAKELQKPLAIAKDKKYSRKAYSVSGSQKRERVSLGKSTDVESSVVLGRGSVGRPVRPPVRRALLGEIKRFIGESSIDNYDHAVPSGLDCEPKESAEFISSPYMENFTLQ